MNLLIKTGILCMVAISNAQQNLPTFLPNIECGPYTDYVATDPGFHRYSPYFVKLHRCHGANLNGSPRNRKCVPIESKIQNLKTYGLSATGPQILTVKNHTACEYVCSITASSCSEHEKFESKECFCSCKYTKEPTPSPCVTPMYWDQTKCKCVCPYTSLTCAEMKEFSAELCGCICKQKTNIQCSKRKQIVDESTCYCVPPPAVTAGRSSSGCDGGVKGGILAVIMIFEALAFVVAYFFLYIYCYKRRYLPKKKLKIQTMNQNNVSHHNGFTPVVHKFNVIPLDSEETEATNLSGKQSMMFEEDSTVDEHYPPNYYTAEEKSLPFTSKLEAESYMYLDVEEVSGPKHALHPPRESCSEFSEDSYASVTQV